MVDARITVLHNTIQILEPATLVFMAVLIAVMGIPATNAKLAFYLMVNVLVCALLE